MTESRTARSLGDAATHSVCLQRIDSMLQASPRWQGQPRTGARHAATRSRITRSLGDAATHSVCLQRIGAILCGRFGTTARRRIVEARSPVTLLARDDCDEAERLSEQLCDTTCSVVSSEAKLPQLFAAQLLEGGRP